MQAHGLALRYSSVISNGKNKKTKMLTYLIKEH